MCKLTEYPPYYWLLYVRGCNLVSYVVAYNSFVFIVGLNGSGKSTLLKALPDTFAKFDDFCACADHVRSGEQAKHLWEKTACDARPRAVATVRREVMNEIPLKNWNILERTETGIDVYNCFNSKVAFDRFELSGLNNCDLFEA